MTNPKSKPRNLLTCLSIFLVCFGVVWFWFLKPTWDSLNAYQVRQANLMPPVIPQAQKVSSSMAGGLSTNFEHRTVEYQIDTSLTDVQEYYETALIDYCKSPVSRRTEDLQVKLACYKEPCQEKSNFQYAEVFVLKLDALSNTQTKITTYYYRSINRCDPDADPFRYNSS
jgi:hypothetical protein